jgi:hypothetical protein
MGDSLAPIVKSTPLAPSDDETTPKVLEDRLKDAEHKRGLRGLYAFWVLVIAIAQIVLVNLFFLADGIGALWKGVPFKPGDDLFKVFIVSVFVEVIALALVVTRSLFPGEGGFLESFAGLFSKKGE